MKILIFNWRDMNHPLAGGAEVSTHEHAKSWVKAGHSVTQFSASFPGCLRKEDVDGVTIIRRGNQYTVHLHAYIYYKRHLENTMDLIVDEFHGIPFFTPLYVNKKKLAYIHETAEEIWFRNKAFPLNVVGFFVEKLSFILYRTIPLMTVSESTKRDLIRFNIPEKNIYVIYNGLHSLNSFAKKENKPTLIYLGRLAKDKGVLDAVDAFFQVHMEFSDSVFWIVGREETKGYRAEVERRIKELGLQDSVRFFGHISEKSKFDLLKKAWILIHPSIKEGWGFTVMEAASQRTPCVGYDIAGLRDSILDKKTGLLAKNKDIDDLVRKISLLFKDEKLYNSLSENAFEWSKKFNWDKSTKQSLKLIESIV